MDRMNAHSTNRDGLLLLGSESRSAATTSSASHFVLQWGSRKRLRCMKVHAKDHSASTDPIGSRTVQRATTRIDRRVVRSDANNNGSKHPIPNRHNIGNSVGSGSGHLNLRQRPASPSPRILRNSEDSIGGMKGNSNGAKDLASLDRKISPNNTNSNIKNNNHHHNNNTNHHHTNHNHHIGGGSSTAAVWPPKFVIGLTDKEKEEDFMAIKGSKLPQRPKKRAKFIQRTLNLVSPGGWLCDLTLERYEVREKRVSKKRPRGLKAMGNMDSDSE